MNNIFVVSGPSGSGKSTLIKMLRNEFECTSFSVSYTTRKMREGEIDKRDYYFISKEKFFKMIKKELFAEWAKVHNEFYGTSIYEIDRKSKGDKILILDIDVQGGKIIKNKFPSSCLVFIKPPSIDELKKRLLKREKVLSLDYKQRIVIAEEEMKKSSFYDKVIINDDLTDSFNELKDVFQDYKSRFVLAEGEKIN